MARVLVTGAAGLLGSACVRALTDRGDDVVALVRDRDPASPLYSQGLIDRCIEVRGDLGDSHRLLSEYLPDAVLHLAAQTQVPVAGRAPLSTFESNVRGTWQLLEACRLAPRVPRVAVASSDKAYGDAPLPYTESTPLQARSPYDVSKACTDLIAQSYAHSFELPVVVTRSGNLYGPGDGHPERLIPHCCLRLLAGLPPILRGTGAMSREWLYVDDAAAASVMLLDQADALGGRAFNVGGGQVATVAHVVETLRALTDGPAPQINETEPSGEIQHQRLDTSALRALGWTAQVGLDEGLQRTLAWWAQRRWNDCIMPPAPTPRV